MGGGDYNMNTTSGSDGLAIKTTELTRRFGDLTAVDHVDLEIPYGEIFGLLGANGAGKSTVIKMLTTLLAPTSGTAEVGGFDIIKYPAEIRGRIGYVPQLLSADGALTGYENLLLSAKLYGLPRPERSARIGEALTLMGLTDSARKLVKTYSGGMIRRLELAQAMLHRPAILFLDEPTIGLDPVARHAVWDRLAGPQARLRHDGSDHDPRHGGSRSALRRAGDSARGAGRRRWKTCRAADEARRRRDHG